MNLIEEAKRQIDALLQSAYESAAAAGQLPGGAQLNGIVEIPKDSANGDYAANHAMTAARALRCAPRKIGEALLANLNLDGSYFDAAELAGPGFLNFRLGRRWYAEVLETVCAEGRDYGRSDALRGQKIMVEFVSANPTGPMHMGNARGGVLGDALAEILSRAGAEVWREFYVNDAGNQIEKFANSIDVRYRQQIWARTRWPSRRTAITGRTSSPWPVASAHSTATAGWTSPWTSATRPWRSTACPSTSRR